MAGLLDELLRRSQLYPCWSHFNRYLRAAENKDGWEWFPSDVFTTKWYDSSSGR